MPGSNVQAPVPKPPPSLPKEHIPTDTRCVYCGHIVTIPYRYKKCGHVVDYHCALNAEYIAKGIAETTLKTKEEAIRYLNIDPKTFPWGACPLDLEEKENYIKEVGFDDKDQAINRFQFRVYAGGIRCEDFPINPKADPGRIIYATNFLTHMMADASGTAMVPHKVQKPFFGFTPGPANVTSIGTRLYYQLAVYAPKIAKSETIDEQGRKVSIIVGMALTKRPDVSTIFTDEDLEKPDFLTGEEHCFPPPLPPAPVEPIEINCVPSEMHCLPSEPVKCCTIL